MLQQDRRSEFVYCKFFWIYRQFLIRTNELVSKNGFKMTKLGVDKPENK